MNKNLNQLIKILKKYEVQGIFINSELEDVNDFLKEYEENEWQLYQILESEEGQTFTCLYDDGTYMEISVKSREEREYEQRELLEQ
ncbi:hypothetical protein CDLVIII_3190 [Clostridium sp. DL-VIII]|uniref:hypothetical protein n=1 Tax=Clostridium sp. DL-VIII TaxID=641107 RepID=UPI00023AFFC3|nr:hypothetical protein [Clostridium sp. DL-VIII]EHI99764.1 hypothetical protein CDLVIII_3190 [Clostridium sp. DL-VIII]